MRRLSVKVLPFLALIFVLFSCKKDPVVETPSPVQHGNFYSKIANVDWEADFSYANEEGGRLKIVAATHTGTLLVFNLEDVIAKTYTINDKSISKVTFLDSTDGVIQRFDSNVDGTDFSGTITITKNDPITKTVSGTFNLVLKNVLDGHLLTLENGAFTTNYLESLTIDAFNGYDVFFGVYNIGGINNLGLWYRDPVDDKIVTRNIGVLSAENIYNNAIFDNLSKNYFAVSGGEIIRGMNTNTGAAITDKDFIIWAPTAVNGKVYGVHQPYDTADRQSVVDFDISSAGIIHPVTDSLIVEIGEKATMGSDGENLYLLPIGTAAGLLLKVNINDGSQTLMNYPYTSFGFDYIGNSTFLTVIDSISGSTMKKFLAKVQINFGQVDVTIVKDLDLSGFADAHQSTTFNKTRSRYFVSYSSPSENKTLVRTYSLINQTLALDTIPTFMEGIKAKD